MDSAKPVDKVFSGKRRDERLACAVSVLLHSGRRRFEGTTVDISRTGVQVRIPFTSFTTTMSGQRVGTAINAADRHFGGGFLLEFPGRGDPIPMVLVRMVVEVDEPDGLRLGCEFRTPLSPDAIKRLTAPVKKGSR